MAQEAAWRLLDRFEGCSHVAYHKAGMAQDIGSGAGLGSSGRGMNSWSSFSGR
jgi:GH24 family phage-related lysozyme (muramidase)